MSSVGPVIRYIVPPVERSKVGAALENFYFNDMKRKSKFPRTLGADYLKQLDQIRNPENLQEDYSKLLMTEPIIKALNKAWEALDQVINKLLSSEDREFRDKFVEQLSETEVLNIDNGQGRFMEVNLLTLYEKNVFQALTNLNFAEKSLFLRKMELNDQAREGELDQASSELLEKHKHDIYSEELFVINNILNLMYKTLWQVCNCSIKDLNRFKDLKLPELFVYNKAPTETAV